MGRIFQYCIACVRLSWKSSWNSVGGTTGTLVLTVLGSLSIDAGIREFLELSSAWLASALLFLTDTVIVFIVLLALKAIFISPFKLVQSTAKKLEAAQTIIDGYQRAGEPDLPFEDAMTLAHQFYRATECTGSQMQQTIVEWIFNEKLTAWGMVPLPGMRWVPRAPTMIKIPHQFFYSPNGGPTEDNGYVFEIYTSLPNWEERSNHKSYCNVTLNKRQFLAVMAVESTRKATLVPGDFEIA
ncbi:MAG: hypothetical protein IPH75_15215 [bacterium]|nr:hypothetical protein [bacterium]